MKHIGTILILTTCFINFGRSQVLRVPDVYSTIDAAIQATPQNGDTILIAAGTYKERLVIDGKQNLVIIGEGSETIVMDTTYSGFSKDGCSGLSFPVLTAVISCSNSQNIQISGLTIRDGYYGVDIQKSDSIRVVDNDIISNFCQEKGRGVYIHEGSSVTIQNNFIRETGTGVYVSGNSFAHLEDNLFDNCRGADGGGIWLDQSEAIIRDNMIRFCWDGAINVENSQATVIRNEMIDNDSWTKSGGMNITDSSEVIIYNTLIKENRVSGFSGSSAGIASSRSKVEIYNSIIANNLGNNSNTRGVALSFHNNAISIARNNIFYENKVGAQVVYATGSGFHDFAYNTIYSSASIVPVTGMTLGAGNLFLDPLFCNEDEYQLKFDSPCVNAGDPDPMANDLDGSPNDMGVHGGPYGDIDSFRVGANPLAIPFGGAMVCDLARKRWSFVNHGTYGYTIDSVGFNRGDFFYLERPFVDSKEVCGGNKLELEVVFRPASLVTYTDTMWVYGRDSTFTVPLSGMGISCDSGVYYHAFQNFNDDVFRTRTFANLFGGNSGIINQNPDLPQFVTSLDTLVSRSDIGRSLKITYDSLNTWSMLVESFNQSWTNNTQVLDLLDLFPDFANPRLQNRSIDSIAFYVRLDAARSLTISLELHDSEGNYSSVLRTIPASAQWQKISVALNEFIGDFNPHKAKFFGIVLSEFPNNKDESGILYIDDFYLVECGYTKPSFATEDDFLNYVNEISFRHFWMAVDPVSKFAWDRHIWDDLISVDAIGFQLSAYSIAKKRGWIKAELLEERVERILHDLVHVCKHTQDTSQVNANPLDYATVNGIWAHFLDNKSLARKDENTEYSLFTNALLLAGVHVAMEAFSTNANINNDADALIRMSNWNFLYRPQDSLMYYDWKPGGEGYSDYYTDWFSEELDLVFLLGISTPEPSHRLPVNPYNSPGYEKPVCGNINADGYVYSAPGANFTYYFLQMYGRFQDTTFRFQNTRKALLKDVLESQNLFSYLNYDPKIFGNTACEGPDSSGFDVSLNRSISNYHAYGYECKHDTNNNPNGTVAVYGSGSTILYIPDEAIACLNYYYTSLDSLFKQDYQYEFWSPIFGFPDAFHLDPDKSTDKSVSILKHRGPWLSVPRFGIDLGPMLMSIDSYLCEKNGETSIRDLFTGHDLINIHIDSFKNLVSIEKELPLTSFNLYPNPTFDRLNVEIQLERPLAVNLSVVDLLGRELMEEKMERKLYVQHPFSIRHLSAGTYLLKIEAEGVALYQKFIVRK